MRRGLSLLEVVISVALLAVLLVLFVGILGSSGNVLASSYAVTECVERSEAALARLDHELKNTGATKLQLSASNQQEGAPQDTIRYQAVRGADPVDPFAPLWSEWRVIRFEPQPGETVLNKTDDDRDYRIDEGRVVLYRDPPSAANRIAVLCVDVVRFEVELQPGAPDGLPSLRLTLRTEEPIRAAARTLSDQQQLVAGGGPRAAHTARRRILIPN